MVRLWPLALGLAPLLFFDSAFSQNVRAIPDVVACRTCVVQVISEFDLRPDGKGLGSISFPPNAVEEDVLGRIWVLGDGPFQIFSGSGLFARTLGTRGRGPNEYEMPTAARRIASDSMVILDAAMARVTVLDSKLAPRRTIRLPYIGVRNMLVLRWPSLVILSGWLPRSTSAGYPLHLVSMADADVRILRSFGSGDGRLRLGQQFDPTPLLTHSLDERVLSIDPLEYQLSQWDGQGALASRWLRTPAWFSSRSKNSIGGPAMPPPPTVAAIAMDAITGFCWVFVSVPAKDWHRGWTGVLPGNREVLTSSIDQLALFDTIVEVLDLRRAQVITRATLRGRTAGVLSGLRAVIQTSNEEGQTRTRVVHLGLSR